MTATLRVKRRVLPLALPFDADVQHWRPAHIVHVRHADGSLVVYRAKPGVHFRLSRSAA